MKKIDVDDTDIIKENTYFIVIDSKDCRKSVNVSMGKIKLTKVDIQLKKFLGKKLNTFWEYDPDTKDYFQITSQEFYKEELIEGEEFDYDNEKISKANNKEIYTSTIETQRQRTENVNELKKQGKKGDEMISETLANNESMAKRTLLSQQKIIKRLEIRHKYQIFLAKSTLFNIMESIYTNSYESKLILYMRVDTISTILQNLKFINNSKTIVYEETCGLLTAAIAGRATGNVMSVFESRPNMKFIPNFNYSNEKTGNITSMNIANLVNFEKSNKVENLNSLDLKEDQIISTEVKSSKLTFLDSLKNMLYNNFSNLVVCCKEEFRLLEFVLSLYPYLKPSGTIVVYARDKEYLLAVEKYLFENKLVFNLNISETIFREYQILPLRTHPMMNMHGFSNYVLVGIKSLSHENLID